MKKVFKFVYVTLAVLLTSYICSKFTNIGIVGWYNNFDKPQFTPPNIVFPIAWSIIYTLIIISTYIALRDASGKQQNKVNNIFLIQLALQILWCFSFFAEGQIGFALAVIVLLGISIFKMISIFLQINKLSGILLYPYYWWVVFATFLNAIFVAAGGMIIVF